MSPNHIPVWFYNNLQKFDFTDQICWLLLEFQNKTQVTGWITWVWLISTKIIVKQSEDKKQPKKKTNATFFGLWLKKNTFKRFFFIKSFLPN